MWPTAVDPVISAASNPGDILLQAPRLEPASARHLPHTDAQTTDQPAGSLLRDSQMLSDQRRRDDRLLREEVNDIAQAGAGSSPDQMTGDDLMGNPKSIKLCVSGHLRRTDRAQPPGRSAQTRLPFRSSMASRCESSTAGFNVETVTPQPAIASKHGIN